MAKTKNDNQQVIETKKWIKRALFNLMAQNEFSRITVSQIANQADINRRTFYRHYKTKEEVLDDYLLSLLLPHFKSLMNQHNLNERQLSEAHFTFFSENIVLLRLLKQQNLFGYLLLRYQEYIRIFSDMRGEPQPNPNFDSFRVAFKTGGFLSIISEWLEDEPVKSPEEITNIIHGFLEGGVETLCGAKSVDER